MLDLFVIALFVYQIQPYRYKQRLPASEDYVPRLVRLLLQFHGNLTPMATPTPTPPAHSTHSINTPPFLPGGFGREGTLSLSPGRRYPPPQRPPPPPRPEPPPAQSKSQSPYLPPSFSEQTPSDMMGIDADPADHTRAYQGRFVGISISIGIIHAERKEGIRRTYMRSRNRSRSRSIYAPYSFPPAAVL